MSGEHRRRLVSGGTTARHRHPHRRERRGGERPSGRRRVRARRHSPDRWKPGTRPTWCWSPRRPIGDWPKLVVPADAPGVTAVPVRSIDLVRRFARLRFEQVEVAGDAVLGEPGAVDGDVERQLQDAVVLQCAEMVGAIDRVFEFTLEYASDRVLLRPAAGLLPGAQAPVRRHEDVARGIPRLRRGGGPGGGHRVARCAAELVSVAKSYIGDHGPAILQDCVQLHGGIGVTWDHDLHLYLRRVVEDRAQFGTPRDHRHRVAGLIGL